MTDQKLSERETRIAYHKGYRMGFQNERPPSKSSKNAQLRTYEDSLAFQWWKTYFEGWEQGYKDLGQNK